MTVAASTSNPNAATGIISKKPAPSTGAGGPTIVANNGIHPHHGKPKTFSGRPNPINVAYEKKMSELDTRIATTKAKLVRGTAPSQTNCHLG